MAANLVGQCVALKGLVMMSSHHGLLTIGGET